jgi:hypothetical protein
MVNWEEKTNNEIAIKLSEMEYEYQKVKDDIVKLYDFMILMEATYKKGLTTLKNRTKRVISDE